MIKANYTRCEYDSCIYFKQYNDIFTYLLLYVDDMLIAARNKTHIQKLKAHVKDKYDMKDLREVKKILNMEISRDMSTSKLWLSQKNYVLKMLKRFNMAEERPTTISMEGHFRLSSS